MWQKKMKKKKTKKFIRKMIANHRRDRMKRKINFGSEFSVAMKNTLQVIFYFSFVLFCCCCEKKLRDSWTIFLSWWHFFLVSFPHRTKNLQYSNVSFFHSSNAIACLRWKNVFGAFNYVYKFLYVYYYKRRIILQEKKGFYKR